MGVLGVTIEWAQKSLFLNSFWSWQNCRNTENAFSFYTEFTDEIEGWIIDALHAIGCDTAKSVLEMDVETLAKRADLEIEQAEGVISILKAEFEEEE